MQGIVESARHPWLTWPEIVTVEPLEALYAAEPDGLFWFAGETAHPALAEALSTLARVESSA